MKINWPNQKELDKLNALLGFDSDEDEQDWEFVFEDANRLEEFLDLYESREFIPSLKLAFMSLILASYEELLSLGSDNLELWKRISKILQNEKEIHHNTMEYWTLPFGEPEKFALCSNKIKDILNKSV